jgi:hypothetical protein
MALVGELKIHRIMLPIIAFPIPETRHLTPETRKMPEILSAFGGIPVIN